MYELEWIQQKELLTRYLSAQCDTVNEAFQNGIITAKEHDKKIDFVVSIIETLAVAQSVIDSQSAEISTLLEIAKKSLLEKNKKKLKDGININRR